jgi:hypothetical protein
MSSETSTRCKTASDAIQRPRRASTSDLTPRFSQCSQDARQRRNEKQALQEQRERLSERTTCHVIDSWVFLDTFLPDLDQIRLDLVHQRLLERNVLKPSGWRDFVQCICGLTQMTERAMFHNPLEEIVSAIIGILAEDPEVLAGKAPGELVLQSA